MLTSKRNPIGIYEKALPAGMNWEEKLLTAKEIGFDYVEMSIDETDNRLERLYWDKKEIKGLKDIIDWAGIPILSICLSAHRKFPFGSNNPSIREKSMDIMKRALDFAFETGIRIIQLAGYDVYYEEANEKTRECFFENLMSSVHLASRCGITLAMETMDTEFLNSVTKIMNLIKKVNSPWLQIYPDIGNLTAWNKDVGPELELGIEHCVAIHVKETRMGEFKRVPFGTGNVNFRDAISKVILLGYEGPLMIEMWQEDDPMALQVATKAFGFIQEIVQQNQALV